MMGALALVMAAWVAKRLELTEEDFAPFVVLCGGWTSDSVGGDVRLSGEDYDEDDECRLGFR